MYIPRDRRDLWALTGYVLVIGMIVSGTFVGSAYVRDVLRESRPPDFIISLASENRSEETHLSKAIASANEIRQALAGSIPPSPPSEPPSEAAVASDPVTTQTIAAKQEVAEERSVRRRFASGRSKIASRPSVYRQARHRSTFETHLERAFASLRR